MTLTQIGRAIALVNLIALTWMLSGCGGGGGSATTSGNPNAGVQTTAIIAVAASPLTVTLGNPVNVTVTLANAQALSATGVGFSVGWSGSTSSSTYQFSSGCMTPDFSLERSGLTVSGATVNGHVTGCTWVGSVTPSTNSMRK